MVSELVFLVKRKALNSLSSSKKYNGDRRGGAERKIPKIVR